MRNLNNEHNEQLLILGNGFDLKCGLKSKYEDFFNDLYSQELTESKEEQEAFKQELDKDPMLKHLLQNPNYEDELAEKLVQYCKSDNFWNKFFWRSYIYNSTFKRWEDIEKRIYDVVSSYNGFYNKLFNDLKSFEKEFMNYLNGIIDQKYIDNVKSNVFKLLLDSTGFTTRIDGWETPISYQILSFNFTDYKKYCDKLKDNKVYNVHGNLTDKNIIFGIDGKDNMNKDYYQFTKTYRIMENHIDGLSIQDSIKTIKFYGHGLGEADYSYFQAIFDKLNLYNSDVKLFFYFSFYEGKTEEDILKDQNDAIIRLITKYGETLDNKDHGKNLLHKILLEGRLQIKEI